MRVVRKNSSYYEQLYKGEQLGAALFCYPAAVMRKGGGAEFLAIKLLIKGPEASQGQLEFLKVLVILAII